jgi:excisionase family DNA binding protein
MITLIASMTSMGSERLPVVKFLSTEQIAEILGISKRTVTRMIVAGMFPNCFKAGTGEKYRSPWRVPESDVEEYVKQRQVSQQKEQRQRKR